MASRVLTGSPRAAKKSTATMKANDEVGDGGKTPRGRNLVNNPPIPLQTSGLVNLPASKPVSKDIKCQPEVEDMLQRLRMNDSRKLSSAEAEPGTSQPYLQSLDRLMVHLDDQTKTLRQQKADLKTESERDSGRDHDISSGSELFTPATENFVDSMDSDEKEMERVKMELEEAKSVISRQKMELEETRTFRHTMDQAMGPPSEADFPSTDHTDIVTQSAFNASARPFTSQSSTWTSEDSHMDNSGGYQGFGCFGRERVNPLGQVSGVTPLTTYSTARDMRMQVPEYSALYGQQQSSLDHFNNANRPFSPSAVTFGAIGNHASSTDMSQIGALAGRRNGAVLRTDPFIQGLGSLPTSLSRTTSVNIPGANQQHLAGRSLGMASSPISDLGFGTVQSMMNAYAPGSNPHTYITPLEPMNYRRLLDKTVSCDWKYIVDKIVCNNDQQASIFLQQKLKVGTAEQKFEIVEAIINQAYPLMINRFGNFLVQRCFEHGTPEQVIAIADAIHGNVISLSMDPFGCHVVQKAFDSVPENHKADMVRELLRRIPDTVIHRYACHVWQKLFELRWSGDPPQIMTKVNDALRGMWHEVALGETGSLVVQNIFENCVEEEKRPAIEEVILHIDLIAHGQFGNWCIQHLCEHGSPPDKRRVIDHILTNAYSYSIDQYASKVVEKCLKIGGLDFLDRYLAAITTAHPDRPRIPLIDISGDQYGNYLIQWILMNTHQHQREQVAIHIRKHMVSLRGSKFGSRVAMLCCNPASVTRPGLGALVNPFGAPGQPRAAWNRIR